MTDTAVAPQAPRCGYEVYISTLLSRKTDSTQKSDRCCCSVPETTQQGAHRMRCRRALKPRHVRPIFPVFAGMSGRKRTTLIAVFNAPMCSVLCPFAFGSSSNPVVWLVTFQSAAVVLGFSAVRRAPLYRCSGAPAFRSFSPRSYNLITPHFCATDADGNSTLITISQSLTSHHNPTKSKSFTYVLLQQYHRTTAVHSMMYVQVHTSSTAVTADKAYHHRRKYNDRLILILTFERSL